MRYIWGLFLGVVLLASCKTESKKPGNETLLAEPEVVRQELYGFDIGQFNVHYDTIRNGDSFGEIMLSNHVDYPVIHKIAEEFKDTFDVRRIIPGKPYTILKSKDTLEKAQVFIYENDRINYTVLDLRDSVVAYKKKKDITYKIREVSGVIESSLSQTLDEAGIDYNLTFELENIYAWTVDFFHLQKGDRFKAIYKERYINDTIYAGMEPIEAAYFEHNGEPFYAFAYKVDSLNNLTDYYDDKAKNLQRAFLKAPVKKSRISSRYNLRRRIKYYGYKVRPHRGTDFAAPIGTPILATANGTVVESTRRGGNGKYVKIKHNSMYSTQYLHMSVRLVKKGDFVKQGDVIGKIGMTGNTGGPHVCYRFWKNGKQVDPLREKLPEAEPIADSLRTDYLAHIVPFKEQLDCILFQEEAEEMDGLLTENNP
ncbi:peptidoglycan DD-metalloendopeptidase family protein [Sediminicola luteus]|uniref:Peptidase M23 n=1 Tax=Sediminicola luteus TaxID=319238 RepID=A0A2A4G1I7_9FLAO|nr:peptidoglycan DD-metalloendopeptidase family protein [Sediminicola luteus]PCE62839.1 peptidase M23 [Sediminicola luteus]